MHNVINMAYIISSTIPLKSASLICLNAPSMTAVPLNEGAGLDTTNKKLFHFNACTLKIPSLMIYHMVKTKELLTNLATANQFDKVCITLISFCINA